MQNLSYLIELAQNHSRARSAEHMHAVVTLGFGGTEQLVYQKVGIPVIRENEVLIKVHAAGINNTEINTRVGWYSSDVQGSTDDLIEGKGQAGSGGWSAPTPFPMIQGADCCGEVVEVGESVKNLAPGARVMVRPSMRVSGYNSLEHIWLGVDFDGAFAEYVAVPASETFSINSDWASAELATIPCAFGTAEGMVSRAAIKAGERVLVTGASGGVGSAVIQLAKLRGAHVIAVAASDKEESVLAIGADQVFDRSIDLLEALGEYSVDLVFDAVGGDNFMSRVKLLDRGGRLVTCGAIAGSTVAFDLRDCYLRDLNFIGCTAWNENVFEDLLSYIERDRLKPTLSATYALSDIAQAQEDFIRKTHFGKLALIP